GWLETRDGKATPEIRFPWNGQDDFEAETEPSATLYLFDQPELHIDFQWLRTPHPERLFSLSERPGYLRLYGRETIGSQFEQSLLARRQTDFSFVVTTVIEFTPANFQQSAGIVAYYNSSKFHYGFISADTEHGRHLRVLSVVPDASQTAQLSAVYPLPPGPIELRMEGDYDRLRFAFRAQGANEWTPVREEFDLSLLSDEAVLAGEASFTGTLLGIACQDMSGNAVAADFAWLEYAPTSSQRVDSVSEL
ncbi:MAG: beta-xylosidase family glycoside hydrolase, partial [Asticcacaulis sp.]